MNLRAVDHTLAHLYEVKIPELRLFRLRPRATEK